MRIIMFSLGFCAGVGLTLLVGYVATVDAPRPAIVGALPASASDIPESVDRAVKARFPLGMSEDQLIGELSGMGFVIRNGGDGLWADYTAGGMICMESFMVNWASGQDRLVSQVSGGYHLSCL